MEYKANSIFLKKLSQRKEGNGEVGSGAFLMTILGPSFINIPDFSSNMSLSMMEIGLEAFSTEEIEGGCTCF
jgi:hypothetical protein